MNEYAMAHSASTPKKSLKLWRTDKHTKLYAK